VSRSAMMDAVKSMCPGTKCIRGRDTLYMHRRKKSPCFVERQHSVEFSYVLRIYVHHNSYFELRLVLYPRPEVSHCGAKRLVIATLICDICHWLESWQCRAGLRSTLIILYIFPISISRILHPPPPSSSPQCEAQGLYDGSSDSF
jgi:hypothetical protein